MKLAGKIARLRRAEWALLARAGLLAAAIRAALWVVPWPSLIRVLDRLGRPGRLKGFSADRLAWAVRHASRLVPRATCLTQALALHHLLTCSGLPSAVEIGVAKTAEKGFQAHAWVEHQGGTLLNRPDEIAGYARLLTVKNAK